MIMMPIQNCCMLSLVKSPSTSNCSKQPVVNHSILDPDSFSCFLILNRRMHPPLTSLETQARKKIQNYFCKLSSDGRVTSDGFKRTQIISYLRPKLSRTWTWRNASSLRLASNLYVQLIYDWEVSKVAKKALRKELLRTGRLTILRLLAVHGVGIVCTIARNDVWSKHAVI